MNSLFELQWNTIRQSQRMMEHGITAHRSVTEFVLRTSLRMGHDVQRQGTKFTRKWMDAYGNLTRSQTELVTRSFTSFVELQRETSSHVVDTAADSWFTRPSKRAVAVDTDETAEPAQTGATTTTGKAAEIAGQTTTEEPEHDTSTDNAVNPESDAPPASDEMATATAESEPLELQYLSGIGTAYEDRLEAAGITNVEALADADPQELASQTTLPETHLRDWIEQAKHHVQRS